MLRLLIDQDLDHVILRGLLLRVPNADVMTAHQVGLSDTPDPDLLAGAEEQKRIVVTHDRRTMPSHAAVRIARGESVAGVIVVSRRLPVSQVLMISKSSSPGADMGEWENIIKHLPL
jgi:hypothetical protein